MRTRFHGCMKLAAMGCVVVLLAAGTARLLHTSGASSHKHGKAVSEDSSPLSDHLLHVTAALACALPSLEIRGPVPAKEKSLPSRNRPLLRRLRGRAPPAWS
jgi:hypothetical protein